MLFWPHWLLVCKECWGKYSSVSHLVFSVLMFMDKNIQGSEFRLGFFEFRRSFDNGKAQLVDQLWEAVCCELYCGPLYYRAQEVFFCCFGNFCLGCVVVALLHMFDNSFISHKRK